MSSRDGDTEEFWRPQRESNPKDRPDRTATDPEQNPDKSLAAQRVESNSTDNNDTIPEQHIDTSAHQKCATCVQQILDDLSTDLAEVVKRWEDLSEEIKKEVLSLVRG